MKKILIFSSAYFPFVGGAEVAVKEMTDRLPDFSFDMITVNLDGQQKKEEQIGNVRVYRIGKGKQAKYFFPFFAKKFANTLHEKNSYDLLWAIMANQAGLAASFFKKFHPKIPLLLTLQEGDSEFDIWIRTWYIRPLYRKIYQRADFIQAISHFLARRAKNLGAKCQVEVVPNGVTMPPIRGSAEGGSSLFMGEERTKGKKIIITTSRLVKKNGIDVLLRALKELRIINTSLAIQLYILGAGELENTLKELSGNLGIDASVKFFGHVAPEKIHEYLAQADIFVRPSRSEGLGSSFLEAMACGVPIIGTRVGGIPDFLEDGETGLFCKVDDPGDLAEKIQHLFNDQTLYRKLSENGMKLVREKYQWETLAYQLSGIFYKLFSAFSHYENSHSRRNFSS